MLSNGYLLNKRYLIKDALGKGLAGHTYLAMDTFVPGSVCAIKELSPRHEKGSPAYQLIYKKFQEEARYLRILEGYNGQIPQLYDEISENETLYIVQEYIEGETLQSLITSQIMSQSKVRDLLVDLLNVVVYIHSKDIIHRDIKPANIILWGGTGMPVLIDFGSVKDLDITQVGPTADISELVFRSEGYTAPEQLSGNPVPASDIFSLGKTAMQMLTRQHPRELSDATWRNELKGLLPEFGDIIDKAIKPYLPQRYDNAEDMLNDLKRLVFSEDREKIAKQISKSLTVVEREPRPFPKVSRKCNACDFVVSIENEFCPNCAEYNSLKLHRKDFILLHESAEKYFDQIVRPTMDKQEQALLLTPSFSHWDDKPVLKFIDKWPSETRTHWLYLNRRKIEALAIVPLIILSGILVFSVSKIIEIPPTIYWLIPCLVLPGITVAIFEVWTNVYQTGEINRVRAWQGALQMERWQIERRITEESKKLGEELAKRSKTEKRENRTLLAKESLIDKRISEISSWTNELRTLLLEISDETHGDHDLQQVHSVNLKRQEQIGSHLQKKYHSKKLEVQLLRLNNSFQKQAAVDEMTHELRVDIKKKLGQLIDLCNQIVADLTEAAVTVESGGAESLVRVLEIGKIAARLRQALREQGIELALPGRTSDKSTPMPQFVKGMALLNAYVCIDDFSAELDMLEKEFVSARRL